MAKFNIMTDIFNQNTRCRASWFLTISKYKESINLFPKGKIRDMGFTVLKELLKSGEYSDKMHKIAHRLADSKYWN